ncbi:UDP-N-acetylmuramoyl-L-alanine--D-glutamate ligase [Patescibacteria group bacterium]|nr:MAG: UDP-N-acetylmuramoyl-L-alanine--D-glutamate ligase [Patescibacteria group bacterium]
MPIDFTKPTDLQDAVVTVMGLGRFKQGSGIGAAKWLMRHGAQIVVTDLKSEADLKASVDLVTQWYEEYRKEYPDRDIYAPVFVLGEHREEDFENVQLVVKNPDVPKESAFVKLAEKNGVRVESDVSLFWHFYPHPICAVTGTRGKSTTTALIGEMLKRVHPKTVVAGNIMHSPLEELDWMLTEEKPVPVALELSSWLLEGLDHVKVGPEVAVLTNVSMDHLDRYESFDAYLAAKEIIFNTQSPSQKAVLNYDHEIVRKVGERVKSRAFWFSAKPLPESVEGTYIAEDGTLHLRLGGTDREICHPQNWPCLQGEHNVQNALAATLAAALAGVPDEGLCMSLRTFEGLQGRQQTVREFDGVTYVNDTNATSPDAVVAALKRFANDKKRVVLIVGGKAKGFSFDEMAAAIREHCKHVVYLEGSSTAEIEQAVGTSVPSVNVSDMESAVLEAKKAASAGDIVLLSPGTASFGLFKNAYDRGGQFVEAVKNLK